MTQYIQSKQNNTQQSHVEVEFATLRSQFLDSRSSLMLHKVPNLVHAALAREMGLIFYFP